MKFICVLTKVVPDLEGVKSLMWRRVFVFINVSFHAIDYSTRTD